MARTRFPADAGLTSRMLGTMFLLGLLYVVFVAVLIAILKSWVLIVLIAGIFLARIVAGVLAAVNATAVATMSPCPRPSTGAAYT